MKCPFEDRTDKFVCGCPDPGQTGCPLRDICNSDAYALRDVVFAYVSDSLKALEEVSE